ncbi:MAG: DUF192 domain-containing protein [Armatimonadota bacterium]
MEITVGSGYVLSRNAVYAKSLLARIRGLISHRPLSDGEALVIPACRQVHTFFMRFSIDIVFANRDGRIVGIEGELPPSSFSGYHRKAYFAVELPAGAARRAGLEVGGMLLFKDGK